ncbi:predicted protein [Uncinocarpus reesii 1704]|uniref:Uncharacterized protein n=1 Tax=Uncinocarpus reesii (strain UAMH 1704) TaxID=336963 RepID=C4JL70_UNCRE|nr:uncharacterized protein UREG_03578 [Uncinocarpus reesii 1704]EEP78732.1 predicted protein [Uncinocarpus reesii 1704]
MLKGSANYPQWKEEIELVADQAGVQDILKKKQTLHLLRLKMSRQYGMSGTNGYLNYISASIPTEAKLHFKTPTSLKAEGPRQAKSMGKIK